MQLIVVSIDSVCNIMNRVVTSVEEIMASHGEFCITETMLQLLCYLRRQIIEIINKMLAKSIGQ